jgi:hypothetical protein
MVSYLSLTSSDMDSEPRGVREELICSCFAGFVSSKIQSSKCLQNKNLITQVLFKLCIKIMSTNDTKPYTSSVMQYPFTNFQDLVKAMTISKISSSRKSEEQFQFCCMKSMTIQNGLYHTDL